MTDHVVSVGAVQRTGAERVGGLRVPPAFAYRCSCGAHGPERAAVNLGGKARNEALEEARVDGIAHQKESARR